MSSIPKNKEELIDAIQSTFDKIYLDYEGVPEELTRKQEIEGHAKGAQVSLCDSLAYLVGWGKLVLKWHNQKSKGFEVDFPETGYKWNELGQLAQSFHQKYKDSDYDDLLSQFQETTNSIVALVQSLSNKELYEVPWYEKWTLGRMIQFNTSSPMKSMRTKVRRFKKLNGA